MAWRVPFLGGGEQLPWQQVLVWRWGSVVLAVQESRECGSVPRSSGSLQHAFFKWLLPFFIIQTLCYIQMGRLVFGFASELHRELWDSRAVSPGHRPLSPPPSITKIRFSTVGTCVRRLLCFMQADASLLPPPSSLPLMQQLRHGAPSW